MSSQPAPDLLEQGRTDPIHALRDRLPSAAPPYAEGALANPALDEGIVEVLLRNPGLPGELLARIADDDRFRRSDRIKRSLVLHPATPWHVAAQFAKFLHWRDLLQISEDRRYSSALRSSTERLIGDRISQLPQPEKVRLARTAGRGVLPSFMRTRNPQVIQELLLNPRVVERDVLALVSDPNTPGPILGLVARHGNWNRRPPVRMAVLENVSTPIADSLKLLPAVPSADLKILVRNVRIPAPVRSEAEKLLRTQRPGSLVR